MIYMYVMLYVFCVVILLVGACGLKRFNKLILSYEAHGMNSHILLPLYSQNYYTYNNVV